MQKAKPVLIEPVMQVEVVTPEDYMGDVMGDLNSVVVMFRAWTSAGAASVVTRRWCHWRNVWLCANTLRSKTQGRANVFNAVCHYEEGPTGGAEEIAPKNGLTQLLIF